LIMGICLCWLELGIRLFEIVMVLHSLSQSPFCELVRQWYQSDPSPPIPRTEK
jgi:hypothetical protein